VFNGDTAYIAQLKQQKSKRCDFILADGGAGDSIHTTVHILGRVSGTGNRHPIPMGHVPTVSYQ